MYKEVSFIRDHHAATSTPANFQEKPTASDGQPLRRIQTASPLKSRQQKEKYLDAAEYLAQRRKLQSRKMSSRNIHSAAANSKNFEQETIFEIDNLIKSTERDSKNVFITNNLSRYRLLHEIINLNRNPIDFQTLSKLQKRENVIIQTNAIKDDRYVHLVDSLQPTKRYITHCLKRPVIYNAYKECEIIANRYLKELRESQNNFTHVETTAMPVMF